MTFDWTKIELECPKSWLVLAQYLRDHEDSEMEINEGGNLCIEGLFDTRSLYDFFDEQGIIGLVNRGLDASKEDEAIAPFWFYDIQIDREIDKEWNDYRDSRSEAETALFIKCFHLLEERLNDEHS